MGAADAVDRGEGIRRGTVEQGRAAVDRCAWNEAYRLLAAAAQEAALHGADLERLAVAAYLTGLDDAAVAAWEQAHHAFIAEDARERAVRCAFWIGVVLFRRGEHARGGGWIARAHRLLEGAAAETVEHGYLLCPAGLQALEGGDVEAARATFERVAALGDRFGDADLATFGRLGGGQALVASGAADEGITLLDEAMIAVTGGEVSPVVAGIVYCAVILACQQSFDLRRAQEWTAALSRWCDLQQGLYPYRGQCLVHRSEIMQLRGEWGDALREAEQACAHLASGPGDPVLGMAQYQLAELHRLRGAFAKAEAAYKKASRWGHPVQPGLALLRLAQGRVADAEGAIRRVVEEAQGPVERCRVLAAYVEIVLAAGDVDAGRKATEELEQLAAGFASPHLEALTAYHRGAVLLADGEARGACVALGQAATAWQALEAPYEAARARLLTAEACRALDDHDTAALELDAAREVFSALRAVPALARVEELARSPRPAPGGLTPREVEVLRLVAGGARSRAVAETLVISEKTVARHLNNIYTKLGVSSRAGATAYAYEHDLV